MRTAGLGLATGPCGRHNAITDVPGVRAGHVTLVRDPAVRTGVTAVVPAGIGPHAPLPAGLFTGNGYGKLIGATQLAELGLLESPIVLTATLSAFRAADALVTWMLTQPGCSRVRTFNPVVGECNDGHLSDIRARPITETHVLRAITTATGGPVAEGCVGAGTGTTALGFKAGIGTASRLIQTPHGSHTLGALVQANFSGTLRLHGHPITPALLNLPTSEKRFLPRTSDPAPEEQTFPNTGTGTTGGAGCPAGPPEHGTDLAGEQALTDVGPGERTLTGAAEGGVSAEDRQPTSDEDGSCMIVIATDAPVDARQLTRIARRAVYALARVGADYSHGSGDYAIAFTTRTGVAPMPDHELNPLFAAAMDTVEESVLNSLLAAETTTGVDGRTAHALDAPRLLDLLRSR